MAAAHKQRSFPIRPRGDEIASQLHEHQKTANLNIFPVGYFKYRARIYLLIDEQGRVYTLIDERGSPTPSGYEPLIWLELEPLTSSFERAIEYLVRGNLTKSETREDPESVGLLGRIWRLASKARSIPPE